MSGQIIKLEKEKPSSRCRKWRVRVSLGRDPRTGKYPTRSRRVTGTYRDAERALRDLVAEAEGATSHKRYTVREYAEEWLGIRRASGNVAQRTLDKNETHIKVIDRLLGYAYLDRLTPLDVERSYARMRDGDSPSGFWSSEPPGIQGDTMVLVQWQSDWGCNHPKGRKAACFVLG